MRIMICGANGMLGQALSRKLLKLGELILCGSKELDITKRDDVIKTVKFNKPNVIINAAAYTDVDGCEANTDQAYNVNGEGPGNLAKACAEVNAALVQISTDYVFDGTASTPYKETNATNPQSVYGKSKLLGEQNIIKYTNKYYITRTSWLFGLDGKNFVDTLLRLAHEKNELKIVNDQCGSPTFTNDLAEAIGELIKTPAYGCYHLTNSGVCTWYEFTQDILKQAGIQNINVKPITSSELSRPAPRPSYSVLENSSWINLGKKPLRNYREALKEYIQIKKEREFLK